MKTTDEIDLRQRRNKQSLWDASVKHSKSEGDLRGLLTKPKKMLAKIKAKLKDKNIDNSVNPLGDYPSPVSTKLIIAMLAPVMPFLAYALYIFFTSAWMFVYLMFSLFYISVLIAFAITEIAIRPPWYVPQSVEKGLVMRDLPAYWQGLAHNPKHDLGLDYEEVNFLSWGQLRLRGWFIPARNPKDVGLICVHGGGLDRRSWMRHCAFFVKEGYSTLLFDLSGHGNSDGAGRGFSYGIKEKDDVSAACKFMKEIKKFRVVVAVGTSVGGASVISAAALDKNIDGVIAENPVARADEFAVFHLRKMAASTKLPAFVKNYLLPLYYLLVTNVFLFRIGAFFGYRSPESLVSMISPRPILLMHGTSDDTVPRQHSERLYNAAKEPKELWLAQEAWHCALYDKYPAEFKLRFLNFMKQHFQPKDKPDAQNNDGPIGLQAQHGEKTPEEKKLDNEEAFDSKLSKEESISAPNSTLSLDEEKPKRIFSVEENDEASEDNE